MIGENTIISTCAKILGPITIGKNCVVGTNTVVLTDVVGVPVKAVREHIDITKYR